MIDKPSSIVPLAYRTREAARALGVSERTLWAWTQAGDVPCLRIGRRVLYPVDALRVWLASKTQGPTEQAAKEGGGQ